MVRRFCVCVGILCVSSALIGDMAAGPSNLNDQQLERVQGRAIPHTFRCGNGICKDEPAKCEYQETMNRCVWVGPRYEWKCFSDGTNADCQLSQPSVGCYCEAVHYLGEGEDCYTWCMGGWYADAVCDEQVIMLDCNPK